MNALLIANRGEIAVRIARTCRDLGIRAVGVFAPDDRGSGHLRVLEEALEVSGYLDASALVEAALRSGCDAVHPGYGFLAESADFAAAVVEAGLTWVGPSPAAIRAMGDKRAARSLVASFGVPVLPETGFPLMVKAAGGGGGRGMRLVQRPEDLEEALASARREALAAFGTDELLTEKALLGARHVEVQVFGDRHGALVALGDRDCSLQRRHQKLVEEAPAPELPVREGLHEAACRAARAVQYVGAGTVEFLVEGSEFYFLEMNTRLQVEHPVTEEVTGLDLVEWQLRVAMGEPLPAVEAPCRGHSVEARLCAEDPVTHLPATGTVLLFKPGAGVRVETALAAGDRVGLGYDSLLAKLIAVGPDRATALRRLGRALEQTVLLGVTSNLPLLRYLVRRLEAGPGTTTWLAENPLTPVAAPDPVVLAAAALADWLDSPHDFWRIQPAGAPPRRFAVGETVHEAQLFPPLRGGALYRLVVDGREHRLELLEQALPELRLALDGHYQTVLAVRDGDAWWVHALASGAARVVSLPLLPEPEPPAAPAGSLRSPMPGKVLAVLVAVGEEVEAGAVLMKLEAMKMEHAILAPHGGRVEAIHFAVGELVEAEALLVSLSQTPEPR